MRNARVLQFVPAFRAKSKRQYCGMSFAVARMGDDSNGWRKISRALQGCVITGRGEICNLKAAACIFRLTDSRFPWNPFYQPAERRVEKGGMMWQMPHAASQRFQRSFCAQNGHDVAGPDHRSVATRVFNLVVKAKMCDYPPRRRLTPRQTPGQAFHYWPSTLR